MQNIQSPVKPVAASDAKRKLFAHSLHDLCDKQEHILQDWAAEHKYRLEARLQQDIDNLARLLDELAAARLAEMNSRVAKLPMDSIDSWEPQPVWPQTDEVGVAESSSPCASGLRLPAETELPVTNLEHRLVDVAEEVVAASDIRLREAPCSTKTDSIVQEHNIEKVQLHSETIEPQLADITQDLQRSRLKVRSYSAPSLLVCIRKSDVMRRTEYRKSGKTMLNVPFNSFELMPLWMQMGNGFAVSVADAPLAIDDLDQSDAVVIQQYNGVLRHVIAFPSSPTRMAWDFVGAILITHDLFAIPLQQAFAPPETIFTITMQWTTLIFWTINMFASVSVGYTDHGITVMVPRKIFAHYLKTWFLVDLIVVGSDWAFTISELHNSGSPSESSGRGGGSVKLLQVLRLFRMARLLRMLRLGKTMQSLSDFVDSEYLSIIVSITKMLALLLTVNHILACIWFWIGNSTDRAGWVYAHGFQDEEWHYQYATSLHWALTQFTPASMIVQPHTMLERVFSICVVVFALVGFSYVVGSITGSLTQLRGITENRSRQLWELRRHLRKHKVSIALSARIQRYIEHVVDTQHKKIPSKDIKLLSLLSEQLRSELECEICMPHFSVHPFFDQLCKRSRVTIHRLSNLAIASKMLARTDTLFIAGENATHMYIVVTGSLVYTRVDSQQEEHKELVDKGEDWISEPVLWIPAWVHLGLLTALNECELMVLDPSKFASIIKLNPDASFLAVTYAKNFLAWINSVERDNLSDIWQGENVSERVVKFMELDESHYTRAKEFAIKIMSTMRRSKSDVWVSVANSQRPQDQMQQLNVLVEQ
eukprot:TRINITY_DN23531_c0_g1_i1.p1 TRINITY_DN23531_c0_g1~~TRINITY_DN23531_c0_g1_i1.p1  ORF type:complete len:821 (+),score=139.02 TRINITY_DN23531_c0_g1_i1:68-2530(+)